MRNISCRCYSNISALSLYALSAGLLWMYFGLRRKDKEFLAQNLEALALDFWFGFRLVFGSYWV